VTGAVDLLAAGRDARHDETLRVLFAAHGGEEIDHAGDGFFVAFGDARAAVERAVAVQRRLADHRRRHGFAPRLRIGLHAAAATPREGDDLGLGVHQAARLGATAEADEILASRETVAGLSGLRHSPPRSVLPRGLSSPVEVVTVDWAEQPATGGGPV
jgi:class 3 adenylate cyclase